MFQPEYYGETCDHPFADLRNQKWITLGGERYSVDMAVNVYKTVVNSEVKINLVDSDSAEFAKYMENCYLATKVTFCNEMYDVIERMGLDYNIIREVWLSDSRMGRSHTFVYADNRGYGENCLPKDLNAFVYQAEEKGVDVSLLKSVREKNEKYK